MLKICIESRFDTLSLDSYYTSLIVNNLLCTTNCFIKLFVYVFRIRNYKYLCLYQIQEIFYCILKYVLVDSPVIQHKRKLSAKHRTSIIHECKVRYLEIFQEFMKIYLIRKVDKRLLILKHLKKFTLLSVSLINSIISKDPQFFKNTILRS